ncbi:amidophosphoribosyltransferase [Candidatus Methylacidiphilum fumarolicum]|nr:amidophosphoribosyltransferase [Candidatus Methylacidiphilum fumarolicum]MBW6415542.1 amidophosphoribosyltransferase [Candidatus Methylacidiphilum fumarolicum]TFE68148.1 amidophosphoribosyltransferase [Candidatus Methylacidiphilum fumarolicum]TFE73479.1 amidophosphoribosyltransferase [Candidatus Methylacidiphilum fumarolicum]TFE74400.1 amidophosphoribosyltransferase [Candidatus Methylacidiphilum fumarolicum]TFE76955.1 amidophosphoribosyltransferase [Candidatus Methylacidiphilum fumarolicum]
MYPKEECGVFAIYGHVNSAELTYYGLYALQHRGQESAGIASFDPCQTHFQVCRGMGLVSQVFDSHSLASLQGTMAIGHVRYSTTGSSTLLNAQPIVVSCSKGELALAHNGNIVNAVSIRRELENKGSIFQTTSDSEVILHLMAQPAQEDTFSSFLNALQRVKGAFSCVLMTTKGIFAARDPLGFRPLCLGKIENSYVVSSETCAFDLIHAEYMRDIEPGEVLFIGEEGLKSYFINVQTTKKAFCIFEYVYFARPDSNIAGLNVSKARIQMGKELAKLYPVDADIVVPVPDSGNYAALGYAEQSGIPYYPAFVRNHYIGRTFIQPTQLIRDFSVRIKLNLIQEAIRGKRVIVVDDSIVRGTTARARVVNLREAGAKEVHIRVSCPPHRYPCHYGIDFPNPKSLLANQLAIEDICKYLGADSLGYLSHEALIKACLEANTEFCTACFTGRYPVDFDPDFDKMILERRSFFEHVTK